MPHSAGTRAIFADKSGTAIFSMVVVQTEHMISQAVKIRYATYDASGKNEFLVFYMEPSETNTLDLAAVGPSDLPEFTKSFDRMRQRTDAILRFSDCESN